MLLSDFGSYIKTALDEWTLKMDGDEDAISLMQLYYLDIIMHLRYHLVRKGTKGDGTVEDIADSIAHDDGISRGLVEDEDERLFNACLAEANKIGNGRYILTKEDVDSLREKTIEAYQQMDQRIAEARRSFEDA